MLGTFAGSYPLVSIDFYVDIAFFDTNNKVDMRTWEFSNIEDSTLQKFDYWKFSHIEDSTL